MHALGAGVTHNQPTFLSRYTTYAPRCGILAWYAYDSRTTCLILDKSLCRGLWDYLWPGLTVAWSSVLWAPESALWAFTG